MIRDLSLTLRAILDDPGLAAAGFPELKDAEIVFDRPADTFNPDKPTLNLFLYDVRENIEMRSNEPEIERKNGQVIIHRPPLRVACSYLVTAWPGSGSTPAEEAPLREQRLLGQAIQVLSRHPTIPPGFLKGTLVGQQPPLPMLAAQADGLKNPAEFWTALGTKLRPSFSVTATVGMDVFPAEPPAFAVRTEELRIGLRTAPHEEKVLPATETVTHQIFGRVTRASKPLPDATVTLVEVGLQAKTDSEGRFRMKDVPAGAFKLRAVKDADSKQINITVPAAAGKDYDIALP